MHKNPLSRKGSNVSTTLKVMQHLNSTVTNDLNCTAWRDNKMCCTHHSVIYKLRFWNSQSWPTFLHMLTWGLDSGANNFQATWCLLSLSPCVVCVLSYCTLCQERTCLTWTNHLQLKHQTQPLMPTFCSPTPLSQPSSDFSLILSSGSASALTVKVKKKCCFTARNPKSSYIVGRQEVLFPTHPCRLTAPPSWSTARWAGCSSPPCLRAEPYHRKHPGSGQAAPQTSPHPGEKKGGNWSYQKKKKLIKRGGSPKHKFQYSVLYFLISFTARKMSCFLKQHPPTALSLSAVFGRLTRGLIHQLYAPNVQTEDTPPDAYDLEI